MAHRADVSLVTRQVRSSSTARTGGAATPDPENSADRAQSLRRAYLDVRARRTTLSFGGVGPQLTDLLDSVVPSFADWCAIDVLGDEGERRRIATRHGGCGETGVTHVDCAPTSLRDRADAVDAVAEQALLNGSTETLPLGDRSTLPWGFAVGLHVRGRPFGVVSFVTDESTPGYGPFDLAVAHEAVWGIGDAIERALLNEDAKVAVRATQKIASQLHQLIAVSITLGGLHTEQDILMSLAGSARRVFEADAAAISLDTGSAAPVRSVARRGRPTTWLIGDAAREGGYPASRSDSNVVWRDEEWLVAPLLERRGLSRGTIAILRSGAGYREEDEEVLTLLAQMASTSLGAAELSRTIQRSEERWRILVETAPAGIVEVDLDGRVRWWNHSAGALFAWPSFDAAGAGFEARFPESAIDELTSLWREVLDDRSTRGRDIIEMEINGRRREVTTSAALLASVDEEARSILMLVDDVTDVRQLKAEVRHAQQMEMRGQVASSIAHDFNNLLTLITGYAEMLSRDLADEGRALEMIRDIQATTSRASLLTAQLQTIGRTKSLEPVVLDPVAVLQSNAEVLERIVGVDVRLTLSLDMSTTSVLVDAGQFEQMILNLAINARDAMTEGGELTISVGSEQVDARRAQELGIDEGTFVRILVADTGSGMDEETRARCFEPFFTTKGPLKGTGMGLAAARRLVEESGGSITCRSELTVGTTFEILLPSVASVQVGQEAPTRGPRTRGTGTLLLAEDDEQLRRMVVQVLGRSGYRVVEAVNGEQALQLASDFDGTFDLLISDVVMPEVTGPELARTLQSANPALKVLMMSGTADASVLDDLLPGEKDFLAKPFRPSELIDRVQGLLTAQ